MTAPLLLVSYALVVGTVGAHGLKRAAWAQRTPLLGILAWQALTASAVLSVVLTGAALALPTMPVAGSLAEFIHSCGIALRQHYATPGGSLLSVAGALLALGVVGRIAYCFTAAACTVRQQRSVQRRTLALLAHRDTGSGALVVAHTWPAVYCVPGRFREVVVTSAALAALEPRQLDAVLAHERAHLRGRHDVVLAAASALESAFPFIGFFGVARAETARLIEMRADDTAVGQSERWELATALVRLAEGAAPLGTLGIGGDSALSRVRRLAAPARPLGVLGSLVAVSAMVTVMVLPVAVAAAPAVSAAAMDYCPVGFPA